MNPQLKSILTSVAMALATSGATWAATVGIIPTSDESTLENALVSVALYAIGAALAWYKTRAHTQVAAIAAVNNADNGLKVVIARGNLDPMISAPVKGPESPMAAIARTVAILACLIGLVLLGGPSTARAATLRVAQNGGLGGALVNSVTGRQPAANKSATSASAQSLPAAVASLGAKVQAFTIGDLQNAIALANAQTPPDTRHGACWQAALPVAQAWQLPAIIPNQLGLATAVQTYFDAQASLTLAKLLPDSVVTACALTVSDLQISFAQLATALGVSAVALPKLPVIP